MSGLVLNFVPDPLAALGEMVPVRVDGCTVGAYVRGYAAEMEPTRLFRDAALVPR